MSQDTIESLRARVAELEVELENEQARGIHSCHPGCLRDGCVNRRLRDQLAAQALTIKTMREALDAVQQVANRSEGIAGWHLNGDIASWDSILPEVDEALAISNDATALNELITERTKTQKEYYESVFQDGANRIAELTAEVEYWKTIRTENAVYFEKREAELTAQRDVAIGILEHIRRCIPYGGFAQIHDGSATVADIDAAIANCKEPGK